MTPADVDLSDLNHDEAHVARSAVASYRRNTDRSRAHTAFIQAVVARYNERPNALRLGHLDDIAPVMVFGTGPDRVLEPMPDEIAELYWAWRSA